MNKVASFLSYDFGKVYLFEYIVEDSALSIGTFEMLFLAEIFCSYFSRIEKVFNDF